MSEIAVRLWRFEIFRIGGSPVQLSQCVVALGIILVGLWLARLIARLLVRRIAHLPGMKPSALAAIEKIVFYVLVLAVVAVALQTVHIPISAFAVLGGAFAIGLGFGAQNLFNNFISGLILIIEQPIRVGDLVQIESDRGTVVDVGARCTRIRRADGVDLLVPNSRLLETTVVNWTLSDPRVRTSVAVGVSYGSRTDVVAEVLERCARTHPSVLRGEPVDVFFEDFAADALSFEVHFWTEVGAIELRRVRSDIRFAVEAGCREAGIEIAFPQRDVHLRATEPFPVRLLGEPG